MIHQVRGTVSMKTGNGYQDMAIKILADITAIAGSPDMVYINDMPVENLTVDSFELNETNEPESYVRFIKTVASKQRRICKALVVKADKDVTLAQYFADQSNVLIAQLVVVLNSNKQEMDKSHIVDVLYRELRDLEKNVLAKVEGV